MRRRAAVEALVVAGGLVGAALLLALAAQPVQAPTAGPALSGPPPVPSVAPGSDTGRAPSPTPARSGATGVVSSPKPSPGAGSPGSSSTPADTGAAARASPSPALTTAGAERWLQAHRATTLWSGPEQTAAPLTDLPQWSYLRLLGPARAGRLLVDYGGDFQSRPPGTGWVDAEAVGPSGAPGVWVQNHRATVLWSGPDASAERLADVPQWTRLRVVEGAAEQPDRVQVVYYGTDVPSRPTTGWVARADVGPTAPPSTPP